jgi:hypothetical protein
MAACVSVLAAQTGQPGTAAVPLTVLEREYTGGLEVDRRIAIRADGAVAIDSPVAGHNQNGLDARTIRFPKEGLYVLISDAARAKSTHYLARTSPETPAGAPRCEGKLSHEFRWVGQEQMLGFPTHRYESTSRLDTKTVSETQWLAPDLNCLALRLLHVANSAEGREIQRFERVAQSVKLGDPDPALFRIPDTYREVPPSQQMKEVHERRIGRPFAESPDRAKLEPGMTRADRNYWESQKRKPRE